MDNVCEFCGGSGEKIFFKKYPNGKLIPVSSYCICKKSEYISNNYRLLNPLGTEYIPFDELELEFDPGNLRSSPNYLIKSTKEKDFLFNVKSTIMLHKFSDQTLSFYCCRSIDIVQEFYVKQSDGTFPHISSTDRFDLLVIMLGTLEKNEAIKSCIAQVVHIRMGHKPTWLYLPKASLTQCEQEYSSELENMLKSYKSISLKSRSGKLANSQRQIQAANFGKE